MRNSDRVWTLSLMVLVAACEPKAPPAKSALPFGQAQLEVTFSRLFYGDEGQKQQQRVGQLLNESLEAVGVTVVPRDTAHVVKAVYSEDKTEHTLIFEGTGGCKFGGIKTVLAIEAISDGKSVYSLEIAVDPTSYSISAVDCVGKQEQVLSQARGDFMAQYHSRRPFQADATASP